MRRSTFVLVGAVTFGSVTFFLGVGLFPGGWTGLTKQQFAMGLVVLGTTVGALLGLLGAWLRQPSVTRRTRFLVVGGLCGLLVGLVHGLFVQETCVGGGIDYDSCGWHFLGWVFRNAWTSFRLWIAFGGFMGVLLGWTFSRLIPERQTSQPASAA